MATLTINNQADELVRVLEWLGKTAAQWHLPESTIFKLDLVLNEALPNIIHYAYQDKLNHEILIKLMDKCSHVVLDIVDDGLAFNPFDNHLFQESSSLDSASINGRGIHLIKSFTDSQEYRRIDNFNVVRVTIIKSPETQNHF